MERTQILVIAGALVVVVFVGIQIFAGSGELDEGMPLSRARSAAERGSADDDGGDAGGAEGRSASGSRAGGDTGRGRSSGAGLGSGRDASGSRRESGAGSRFSQTALASRGNRAGGTVGSSGSRGASGTGSSVFEKSGSRQVEGGAPHRSDVVEYLASQPAASGRSGDRDGEESSDDIALELKRPEDADGAGVKKGVEAPEASDEGLTFTEGSVLAFPDGGNVNGEAGTISFEIEPNWNGNDETNNSLMTLRSEHGWSNRIELVKNGRYLRFILSDNVGREADISVPIDAWVPGESHDVEATWGDQKTALYIDGVKVGENTYTEFVRPDAPLFIGSDHRGSTYSGLNGTLRNVKVKNSSSLASSS